MDNKPATSESRMWLYVSGEYCRQHIRIFEYQPDRSGKRPESFLKGFTGYLVTDGYAGYNQVQKVTHCGCWAHARWSYCKNQQGGSWISVLHEAVLSGKEIRICRRQKSERLPPECGLVPSRGVFCMTENDPSGKRQQARGRSAVFPEPEAAAYGISGLR